MKDQKLRRNTLNNFSLCKITKKDLNDLEHKMKAAVSKVVREENTKRVKAIQDDVEKIKVETVSLRPELNEVKYHEGHQ